jgi:predicted transcriptional regulator
MNKSILLPIKPIYADKIISGDKIFEYRRKLPAIKVDCIVLYSTFPMQKISAIVEVVKNISEHPIKLWKITRKGGCISKFDFDRYFNGLFIAHAFKLGKVKKLVFPLPINTINNSIKYPPQSFRYLNSEEFCNLSNYLI